MQFFVKIMYEQLGIDTRYLFEDVLNTSHKQMFA